MLPCIDSGKWRLERSSVPPTGRVRTVAGLRRVLRLHRRVVLLGRERRPVVRLAAGRVEHDVPAPPVEHVAVRVGEVHRDVDLELLRSRLESEHAGVRLAHRRRPRRLDLRVVEHPFLEVERTAGIEGEAVDGVMRVGGVEAVQQVFLRRRPCRRRSCPSGTRGSAPARRARRRCRTRTRWGCAGRRRRRCACPPCRRRRCLRGSGACRPSAPWASSADSSATPPPRAGPWCRTPSARD